MTTIQIYILALVQGLTELFPISSLGHAVVLPALLGWNWDSESFQFLPFLIMLHVGTAVALLIYFWRDWVALLLAVLGLAPEAERRRYRNLLLLMAVATVPAAAAGVLLNKFFHALFGSPLAAAAFLLVNGIALFGGERLRRRGGHRTIADIGVVDAVLIGCCQAFALFPGISRSGATMIAGLLRGMTHEAAAYFSFLIATPVIVGAAVLEIPKALKANVPFDLPTMVIAGAVAGAAAYGSLVVMMRWFHRTDFEALDPFAYYCAAAGLVSLGLLAWVA